MIWESLIALGVEIASKVIVYTVFLQQCSTIIHTGKCIVKALHDLLMRYHYGKQAVLSSHLLKDSMISEGFNVYNCCNQVLEPSMSLGRSMIHRSFLCS